MSTLLSIWTVIVFLFFVLVLVWVLCLKPKEEFEEAANIPFQEDDENQITRGKNNG